LSDDSGKRVQVDDLLPILENAKTTIATTISAKKNFETTSPPPIARTTAVPGLIRQSPNPE
jgi:hypothetical protein